MIVIHCCMVGLYPDSRHRSSIVRSFFVSALLKRCLRIPSLTRIVAAVEEEEKEEVEETEEEVEEMDGENLVGFGVGNEDGLLLLIRARFCVVAVVRDGDLSALKFDVTVASVGTVPGTFC